MKQLTAVEWLIEQLVELDKQLDGKRKNDDATVIKLNPTKIYEQAKEMHKEQIQDAFQEGKWNGYETAKGADDDKDPLIYYNETFESQNP